jgi:long-chain acyl-CoA synthetase
MFLPTLVHEYLTRSAEQFPDKEALICGEERWTYSVLDQCSNQVAHALIGMGMKRHDRVIIFLDNSPEVVLSLFGILKAGGTFVVLNSTIKSQKLRYIIQDSGAKILITHISKARIIQEVLDKLKETSILWVGDSSSLDELSSRYFPWKAIFETPDSRPADIGSIDCDLATLIYTSGSTGEPKGVISSHSNMISAARSIIQYLENTPEDIILNVLPLSFDYGLYQVIMAFMFGGTVVLEKSFLYPTKILEKIENEKVTGIPIVPTMAAMILKMQDLSTHNFSSLRYITNTAAALSVNDIRKLRALVPHVKIYSMYGLTECKRVSYLPPEELDRRPTSVGKAIPNSEVFIMNESGREVAPNEVGELVVRGTNVMQGYWNSPELTAKTFRPGNFPWEKFLYSGDLFKRDDEGFLYFVGRKDDMIKTKGERVSPKEVENVLCAIEGISETAVIGIPDEIVGQAIKAFIVVSPGTSLTKKEVLKHCAEHLEPFMVPKVVEFIRELPKTPNGKTDKERLVDLIESTEIAK